MKVLMVDHFSSTNQYTVELVEELSKYADVTLLTVGDSSLKGTKRYKYKKILYGHENGSMLKRKIIYLGSLIRFMWTVIAEKPDVLHIQTFRNYKAELPIYRLLRHKVKKIIITAHNVAPHEQNGGKSPYLDIYNLCDAIIVHNDVCRKILIDDNQIKKDKIVVIPHGIYNTFLGEKSALEETKKIEFLQFGLIRKYKGVSTLIQAISMLPANYKEKVHFTIAGRQDKRLDDSDYEKMIEEFQLENVITFIPERISDQDMVEMFSRATACTCPYVNIYGSGALLMAYTFDLPVIASDIPAFREETNDGKTGYLFKVSDPQDLCKQLMRFIDADKNEIVEMKKNIKELTEDKYNWKISAKKTYELYKMP